MTQVKYHLSGKEIDLTSDNTIIKSNNFNVDKDGNMSCSNANITGGNIVLTTPDSSTPRLTIKKDDSNYIQLGMSIFRVVSDGQGSIVLSPSASSFLSSFGEQTVITGGYLSVSDSLKNQRIILNGDDGKITCVSLTQTSKESEKKNIEKYTDKALETIKNIDIYKYNFNNEKDKDKKHIGFVIGDNYKYSQEVTSNENNGVDLYSFVSLCCKAIQEQQEEIEKLKERLEDKK